MRRWGIGILRTAGKGGGGGDLVRLNDAEERHNEGALAAASATADADFLPGTDLETDTFKHRGQLRPIFHPHVAVRDRA